MDDNGKPTSRNIFDPNTTPSKIRKDFPNIIKNQEPSPRKPPGIIYDNSKVIFIDRKDFKATVQRLTGKIPTSPASTASFSSSSPDSSKNVEPATFDASRGSSSSSAGARKKARTSNEREFKRPRFDSYGILSSGPTVMPPSILSNYYSPPVDATEKANTSNELGLVGGVETTDQDYHQNRAIERPDFYNDEILSSGPTFMPSISPNVYPPVKPTIFIV